MGKAEDVSESEQPTPPDDQQPPLPGLSPQARQRPDGSGRTVVVGAAAAVLGLLVGGVIGSTIGAARTSGTAAPVATATVTATAYSTVSVTPEPTDQPTTESTERRTGAFDPQPADFLIGIKILSKQCLGAAGCTIAYRIEPKYVGGQAWPTVGSTLVSYQVTGDVLGPHTNTFTIDATGAAHVAEEESAETRPGVTLKAKAIEVDYDPNG